MKYLHTLDSRQVNELLAKYRFPDPEPENTMQRKPYSQIHYEEPPKTKTK